MTIEKNTRELDKDIVRDFSARMSYASYLQLPTLLSAQQPVSAPEHHDEMLFIIQHQTTELWLKLVLHELRSAAAWLRPDELGSALKAIARVKHIQKTLTEQWSVLATLTPTEYSQFRGFLGNSSGLPVLPVPRGRVPARQQERQDAAGVRRRPRGPRACCSELLDAPEHLRRVPAPTSSARASTSRPRCWSATSPGRTSSARSWSRCSSTSTRTPPSNWGAYEACEELVDLEENFQLWRFRHLRTVQRTIGIKPGTGGSSGVAFLQKALDLTFFPELYAVRTEIGQ